MYHAIQELLREKPQALVLDAGDTYQGTYWYTLLKWNITQKFINMIPNDVHVSNYFILFSIFFKFVSVSVTQNLDDRWCGLDLKV